MRKIITLGIMLLFLGLSIIPSTGDNVEDIISYNNISEFVDNSGRSLSHKLSAYLIKTSFPNSSIYELEFSEVSNFTFLCNITGLTNPINRGTFTGNGIIVIDANLDLYKVNLTNGVSIFIGNAGIGELVDIAYDPIYQTIWGISTKNFYEINMTTGTASLVGSMGNPSLMVSLASDKNGEVYAIELDFGGQGNFYSIDITTGTATLVSNLGISVNFNYEFDMLYDIDNNITYFWCIEFDYSNFTSFVYLYGTPTIRLYYVGSNFTVLTIPFDWVNQPPEVPEINGSTHGKTGENYNYTVTGNDPDGDYLYNYVIDWDDNNISGTAGSTPSGTTKLFNHTWSENGNYIVRARVVDIYGATSSWTTLEVKMTSSITLYVGGSGPNNYTKIQDAIDNASDGDTVFVYNGTYVENLNVNKSINLIGENKNSTVIDANALAHCIGLVTDGITVNGFTIQNSGSYYDDSGIVFNSSYLKIVGNIIKNNKNGIQSWCYSFNNIISENEITNNRVGISLYLSKDNTVFHNNIKNNYFCGLDLEHEGNNSVYLNNFEKNRLAIVCYESEKNIFTQNNFIGNIRNIRTPFSVNWKQKLDGNYWGRPRTSPYPIIIMRIILIQLNPFLPIILPFPGIMFDWHPAQEPYDIEV